MEDALKNGDKADIEAKTQTLSEASANLAQKMYAEEAQQAQSGTDDSATSDSADGDSDTVDAEFEEVDDDKSESK